MSRLQHVALCTVLLILLGGCREQPPPATDAARTVVERGPLRLVVEATPREPQVGDRIAVTVAVEVPAGYEVRFPAEDAFGDLGAHQSEAPDPRPGPTGFVWRRTFTLEPLVSGPFEIQSLTVTCVRPATDASSQPAGQSELTSEPLKLTVRSALTAEDNPGKPRDITGTLLPARPPLPAWQWALIGLAVAAVVVGAWAAYRLIRRRLLRPPPPILPEVWALRALADLAADGWFETGRVREFYYRLTEIVRGYVERKFGLAAPDMTTEEFLAALARDQQALPYDARRLETFLAACDFVKYAGFRPGRADAESVLSTARAFVHATAAAADSGPGRDEHGGSPA